MPSLPSPSPAHVARARVRYAETDKMGFAYYANYMVWFEVGRCEWMRSRGPSYRALEDAGLMLPVVEAYCEYRRPLRYDDEMEIRATAHILSPVRVQFRYEIARHEDGASCAEGFTTHAVTDLSGKPRRLPLEWRRVFA